VCQPPWRNKIIGLDGFADIARVRSMKSVDSFGVMFKELQSLESRRWLCSAVVAKQDRKIGVEARLLGMSVLNHLALRDRNFILSIPGAGEATDIKLASIFSAYLQIVSSSWRDGQGFFIG
jgi:hypothetical protein